MSASNTTLYQSSNSSTSTLRPRNARLISFIDDGSDGNITAGTVTSSGSSKTPPLFSSRGSSPGHGVSRTTSLNQGRRSEGGLNHVRKSSEGGPSAQNPDYWSSWSSIASSLLGTDTASAAGKGKGIHKQPRWMKQDKSYASSPTAPQWGPHNENMSSVVSGPLEERQALLQAKKREALLKASIADNRDMTGRYKRRDSNAYTGDIDSEDDALVYMHKIKPNDTLPGVMLKYGCQPDIFRKVNRFWPNDNIQTRKHVFVPVEACSVRGKKMTESADLLGSALDDLHNQNPSTTATPTSTSDPLEIVLVASPTDTQTPHPVSSAEEHDFKHDSWVSIPSFHESVEILRIPRKSLGYFPRTRRKSLAVSDTSTTSTPRSSFDTLRHPPSHAAQVALSLNASPVRRPILTSRSGRQRSSSTVATQNSFVDALRGPGGVGTLRGLRTEPSRPGPADDTLNRKFAQYFPDMVVADSPAFDADSLHPRTFLSAAPNTLGSARVSMDSVRSHRSNSNSSALGDVVGGKIEGFVRKLAGNKGKTLGSSGLAAGAVTRGRMGDLIELETNSVGGSDFGEENTERTLRGGGGEMQAGIHPDANADVDADTPTATSMAITPNNGVGEGATGDTDQRTQEDLLNERFPVRGTGVSAYGRGLGGLNKNLNLNRPRDLG